MSGPARLRVAVVGAGRVGTVLGRALSDAGHPVVAVSGRRKSPVAAGELLGAVPHVDAPEAVGRGELVLLTVPDEVLPTVVGELADLGAWRPGQIVVHTSGRFGAGVLDPVRDVGAVGLALHPVMSFTGSAVDLSRLAGAAFAVTAPEHVVPIGQALVVEMGGEPVVVDESMRDLYCAALAHGAHHLVVLVAQAAQALREVGIERPGRLLAPLLAASLDNAIRHADAMAQDGPGAIGALAGPVARADAAMVREHLRALDGFAVRTGATDVPSTYRELGRSAVRRALRTHRLDENSAGQLFDVLDVG